MAEIDIGGTTYPAFTDVAFADAWLAADVVRAGPWATRQADAKARGLVSATRMMLGLPWCGEAPDVADAPDLVQEVTAELAADLLAKPKLFSDATGNSNVKSVKAGSAAVEFFSPVGGGTAIPRSMWDRLVLADLLCPGSSASSGNDGPYVSGICGGYRPYEGRPACDWPVACEDYD